MDKNAILYGGLPGVIIGLRLRGRSDSRRALGGYFSFALLLYFAEEGVFFAWMLMIPLLVVVLGFVIGIGVFKLIKSKKGD